MQVIVQSNSVPVTAALREFAEKQVARLVRKAHSIAKVSFFITKILGKKNDVLAAKVTCTVSLPGKSVVVSRNSSDVYVALTDVSRHVAEQLGKLHMKKRAMQRRLASKVQRWQEQLLSEDSFSLS